VPSGKDDPVIDNSSMSKWYGREVEPCIEETRVLRSFLQLSGDSEKGATNLYRRLTARENMNLLDNING
jgi:hypothetical protein